MKRRNLLMGKTLYLECNAGISGDMFVAALLDLGADEEGLRKVLESINVEGFKIVTKRVIKAGLDCFDFDVVTEAGYENHDHDMEYLHGHENEHEDHHHEEHEHHEHHHEHEHHEDHDEHDHDHDHAHRGLKDVMEIISKAAMSEKAKKTAAKVFEILADAEAKAHGKTRDTVLFHEVGAIDSIADIVSAAYCLDNLDVEEVISPYLGEGNGTIRCAHGILPIPVPAVANIAAEYGLILKKNGAKGEFVTPTGASIVAAVKTADRLPEYYKIIKIGLGAGKREYEIPGILRAMIIESREGDKSENILKLESNIDDCSGEVLGFLTELLFNAGARDVNYSPVFMKKNRPGWLLTVICDREKAEDLEALMFKHTTSIGIRRIEVKRNILKREIGEAECVFGRIKYKKVYLPDGPRYYPEYDSVSEICRTMGLPYNEVYNNVYMLLNS